MDVMRQLLDHLQQSLLHPLQLRRRKRQIHHKEHTVAARLALNILLDLLSAKIIGQWVRREAETADPSFGIFVFGGVGTDAGSAFGAEEGVCLDELSFWEEGRVEVAEGHDEFLCCVAVGGEAVKGGSPACVLLELFHVDHCIINVFIGMMANQILVSNGQQSINGQLNSDIIVDWYPFSADPTTINELLWLKF